MLLKAQGDAPLVFSAGSSRAEIRPGPGPARFERELTLAPGSNPVEVHTVGPPTAPHPQADGPAPDSPAPPPATPSLWRLHGRFRPGEVLAGRYRVVITQPDGTESIEEVDEPTQLIERSVQIMNSLRGEGWRVA